VGAGTARDEAGLRKRYAVFARAEVPWTSGPRGPGKVQRWTTAGPMLDLVDHGPPARWSAAQGAATATRSGPRATSARARRSGDRASSADSANFMADHPAWGARARPHVRLLVRGHVVRPPSCGVARRAAA